MSNRQYFQKENRRMVLGVINQYAQYHIRSAVYMAQECYKFESLYCNESADYHYYHHRANVTSCILLTQAFLEARINEFFLLPSLNSIVWNPGDVSERIIQDIIDESKTKEFGHLPMIKKYQLGLSTLGRASFNEEAVLFKDACLLNAIRNHLVHFKPYSSLLTPTKPSDLHDLQRKCKGKFPNNEVALKMNRLNFPDIILGYGCAKWAVKSTLSFVKEFDIRVNLNANYYDIADNLP